MNGNPEADAVIKRLGSYSCFIQTHLLLSCCSTGLFQEPNVDENKYIKVKTPEEFGSVGYGLALALAWYHL